MSWDTEQARPDDDDDDETPATFFLQEEKSTDEVLCNGIWKMLEKKKIFEKKEKVLWSV